MSSSNKRSSAAAEYRRLYKTAAWQRIRRLQLLNEPLCRFCARVGRVVPARVVDHVVAHRGDEWLFYNGELQSLCKLCHDRDKQRDERREALGGDANGVPTDPNHHWNA